MWYELDNVDQLNSPALVISIDRVEQNIQRMVAIAPPERLCPHVKTHKMEGVTRLYQRAGIQQFKCATIAEAEMLAACEVDFVLLAHPPVGPQSRRLASLADKYRATRFAAMVDDPVLLSPLSQAAEEKQVRFDVFLDIDVGMHRTGIACGPRATELYQRASDTPRLTCRGLHIYDGHIHDTDVVRRRQRVEEGMAPVLAWRAELIRMGYPPPQMIAGGSASFPLHAEHSDRWCSPGTTVFWDAGYVKQYPDLDFQIAAVLVTRVVSKPSSGQVCVDLGYKGVASEKPAPRAMFLNGQIEQELGHSEEHLVLSTPEAERLQLGDVLYAVPTHICPTVALYSDVAVARNGQIVGHWAVTARDRQITI